MRTVNQVREDIPVLQNYIFLNAGTLFPTPVPVMQAFFKAYEDWHEQGAGLPRNYEAWREPVIDVVRAKLADFLGCEAAELAFTANATEGVNIIAWGIDWQPGDEVIITDAEHPANSVVWLYNEKRFGINLKIVPVSPNPEEFLRKLEAEITPRTRLVAVSHVLSVTGQVLPVQEIVDVAHKHGSLVLIDGAHAVGQMRVNLHELGCDFYTLNGHKWLFGPAGTGALYVNRRQIEIVRPSFMGDVAQKNWEYPHGKAFTPPPGARRYEFATRNWAAIVALGTAIDYVNEIGLHNIRARVMELATYLKQQLVSIPGVQLHSPIDEAWSSGLVAFEVTNHNAKELYAYLEERGICPRYIDDRLMRVTVAYFTLEEELNAMIDTIRARVMWTD